MKLLNLMKKAVNFLAAGIKEFWGLANLSEVQVNLLMAAAAGAVALAAWWPQAIWLLALAPVAFIQNMFFTLVSRSRNSQDPNYHRFCAWGSNGVWFICQVMIVKNIWGAIAAGQWWYAAAAGVVYSLATTEGSVLMMKKLIATEKGKRRVGASDKIDKMAGQIEKLQIALVKSISEGHLVMIQIADEVVEKKTKSQAFFIGELEKRVAKLEHPNGYTPIKSNLIGFSADGVGKEFVESTVNPENGDVIAVRKIKD